MGKTATAFKVSGRELLPAAHEGGYKVLGFATGVMALVGFVGWVLGQPRVWGAVLVMSFLLVTLLAAFHAMRKQRDEARDGLDDRLRPRLSVTVPGARPMAFHPPESGAGNYATIMVSATERVSNCRGHISKIVTDGEVIPLHAPIPLRWIGIKALTRDIEPDMEYGMAVVFGESGRPTETLISTDTHEPRGLPFSLGPGESLLDVVVTGDDVPSLTVVLRVQATGDWKTLAMVPADQPHRDSLQWAFPNVTSALAGATSGYEAVVADTESSMTTKGYSGGTASYSERVVDLPDEPKSDG